MDWGISNTDFITLSFWVKSNKPGIYCCNIEDGDVARVYIKEYTINSSDVWQKVELTYPPPPAGTWKNFDNSTGLRITWSLGTGTAYQGSANSWGTTYVMGTSRQTNFMDDANNTFYLTGVQLEVGKNATEFEHRSYGEELALCQRYYQEIGKGSTTNNFIASGFIDSNGLNFYGGGFLKVTMRTTPVVSFTGTIGDFDYTHPSFSTSVNSFVSYWANSNSYVIRLASSSTGGTTGYGGYARITTSSTALTFNAEL